MSLKPASEEGAPSKLCTSESTVYVANLPFSLTNNDLHQVFEKYGRVVKVTIVKDRETRRSKGVAFVLFLRKEDAQKCSAELNNQQLFGRTVKSSIANDNGRAPEFIRRKEYPNKSRCYECGEPGHLSYQCPRNILGAREPPSKVIKKRRKKKHDEKNEGEGEEEMDKDEEEGEADDDSLSAAIQQQFTAAQSNPEHAGTVRKKPRFKKSAYFSDEEEVSD